MSIKDFLNNKNYVFTLLIGCMVLFSAVLFVFGKTAYKDVRTIEYSNINYDVSADGKELSEPAEFIVPIVKKRNSADNFEISFDFTSKDYKKGDNIFQTDDDNNGVRIEIDEYPNAVITWRNSDDPSIIRTEKISSLKNNEKYHLKLNFTAGRYVKTLHYRLTDEHGNITQNTLKFAKKDYFSPIVNKIIIGAACIDRKIFHGAISNASVKYTQKQLSVPIVIVFCIIEIILLLIIIPLFYFLLKNKFKAVNKINPAEYVFLSLIAAYYPSFLYLHNIFEISFAEYCIAVCVLCISVSLLYFLIGRRYENRLNLFVIFTVSYLYISSGGGILKHPQCSINTLFDIKSLIFVLSFLCIISALITYEIKNNFKKVIQIFVIVLYISLFISHLQPVSKYLISLMPGKSKTASENFYDNTDMPDFYFIIPDMYPNSKNMKKYMNADNSEFLNFLTSKGFYIIENSASNYPYTYQSLPSMLNYSYLNDLNVKDNTKNAEFMSIVTNLYKKNKLFKFFKHRNFKIFFLNSDSILCTNPDNTDFIFTSNYFNKPVSIINLLIEKSIIKSKNLDENTTHYNNIKISFDNLNKLILNDKTEKKFIFAHILAPHFPFVFDRNGNYNLKKTYFVETAKNNVIFKMNNSAFYEQILYVNSRLEEVISNILKTDKKAVILVTSDHAVNIVLNAKNDSSSKGIMDDYAHLHQRMGNFIAVYAYDKNYEKFYKSMTPVTAVRTILNQYYNENLPVEDKIYASSTPETYDPDDVTELVQRDLNSI